MADSICHECRRIDFRKALEFPAADLGPVDMGYVDLSAVDLDADLDRLAETSGNSCPLCQLLASTLLACEDEWSDPGVKDKCAEMPYRLSAYSFLRHCPWVSKDVEGAKDCHILLAPRGVSGHPDYSRWAQKAEDGYIACLPKGIEAGLFVPQLVPDTFDHKKAKLWLWNCRTTHGTACNQYREEIPGLKAIDCETLRVVQIQPGALWVALSYVWGHDQEVGPDEVQPGTIPRVVSKTIQQAIEVTKGLGYKYLWVDRYCINQQDEEEKHGLIAKMDRVYHGADLTIVAAAGHDEHFGLPGIGTTQRKKQKVVELDSCTILSTGPDPILETKRSRWWTRGWTFQEALFSRRRLIFTEHQSYFECDQVSWMEALGGLELLKNPDETLRDLGPFDDPNEVLGDLEPLDDPDEAVGDLELLNDQDSDEPQSFSKRIGRSLITWILSNSPEQGLYPQSRDERKVVTRIKQFSEIVIYYSERNLTFDIDSLNAFAGISRYFQTSNPPLVHILGIPFIPSLISTDGYDWTEKFLFYFLCWFHHTTSTPRRRQNFPSWTWAGWAGRVGWMADITQVDWPRSLGQKMRYIQFEVDGHLIPREAYSSVFDPIRCSSTESHVILCFQARVVPPSMFAWNTYVESRCSGFPDYEPDYEENYEPNDDMSTGTNAYTDENSDAQSQESSQFQAPDPNDWGTWTVGKLKLWDQTPATRL